MALSEACADDQRAAVATKIAGKTVPQRSREEKAEIAVREAEYNAMIATQAAKAAQDQVVEEATRNSAYDRALAERETSITKAALNALDSLEKLLNEIAEVRAYRGWLKWPTRADEIRDASVEDVWITSVTRPNGEPARTQDMLVPVREALEGTDQPRSDQWDAKRHGLPPDYKLIGPWGPVEPTPAHQRRLAEREDVIQGPAARVFEELLQSAEEAPA